MRIKNTIKNSLYAVCSYLVLGVLTLLVRRVFLDNLSVELLGYEGLFGNVFSLLALADLGIESLILYRMFPAFAKNDESEINKIMSIYSLLYKYVGTTILIIGILLIPSLKFIIAGNNLKWSYIYIIYFVQLLSTLCTYFLAYKRLLFTVSQQEFECTKVDTCVSFVFYFLRIVILVVYGNYVGYLLCNLLSNIISNVIISLKVKRNYRFFNCKYKVGLADIKRMGIGSDLKNNLVQKLCGTIYGGTDNIVISMFLGIEQVGLFANYSLIQGYISSFITKILKPFQMSIGNYIYSTEIDEGQEMFHMFDFISYVIACVVSICYFNLFNPFISIWLGEKYVLNTIFLFPFSCNQYILWNHQFVSYYRYSFGKYELDKVPAFFAALLNILFSVILCKSLGVAGIMVGTCIGHLGLWFGRARVVYSEYMKEDVSVYFRRQVFRFLIWLIQMLFSYYICSYISTSLLGLVLRGLFCILFSLIFNIVIFFNTSENRLLISYGKKIYDLIKSHIS